jgi:hypothetical protein
MQLICPASLAANRVASNRRTDLRVANVDITPEGQRLSRSVPAAQLAAWIDDGLQRAPTGHST